MYCWNFRIYDMASPETTERNPRSRLDQLLSYPFQLTEQGVTEKIQELRAQHINFQNESWVRAQISEKINKRRRQIRNLLSGDIVDRSNLGFFTEGFKDLEAWGEFATTRNPKLVTDEVMEKVLAEFAIEKTGDYQENLRCNEIALRFGEKKGANQIFTIWSQVWEFIQSIAASVSNDDDIYPQVREKFPEFCQDVFEYIVFVREMPWHLAAEHLIVQKEGRSRWT